MIVAEAFLCGGDMLHFAIKLFAMLQRWVAGATMTRHCYLLQVERGHDSALGESSKADAATEVQDGAEAMDVSSTEQVPAHPFVVVTLPPTSNPMPTPTTTCP